MPLDKQGKILLWIFWGLIIACISHMIIQYYLTKGIDNYKPKQHKEMEIDSVTITGANLCKWPENKKL